MKKFSERVVINGSLLKALVDERRARDKILGVSLGYEAGGGTRDDLRKAADKFVKAHAAADKVLPKEPKKREAILNEARLRGLV